MTVLVCGDRNWRSRGAILRVLLRLKAKHPEARVVHGANGYDKDGKPSFQSGKPTVRGADMLAHEIATELGFDAKPVPADWDAHGKAAGPIRNQRMLDEHHPEMVLAFHHDLASSRGTADMARRARTAGVPVYEIKGDFS